jgi:hypothetical protein
MKFKLFLTLLAGGLALALAGAAAAQTPQTSGTGHQEARCLEIGRVYSWNFHRANRTLVLESVMQHKFRVHFMGYCPDIGIAERLALRSPDGTSLSCLSTGDVISYRENGMVQNCYIRSVAAVGERRH